MPILLLFAFLAGIVTILSPCILPILPIVFSGSVTGGKLRPVGVILGFIFGFSTFTLLLSALVNWLNISADGLRWFSIIVIFVFGFSLLSPKTQFFLERLFSRLSVFTPSLSQSKGFYGGLFIGLSIGLIWTPCVGPILASVIALALTGSVSGFAFAVVFSYALGTAVPMSLIAFGGRRILSRLPSLTKNTASIQKVFGVIMMIMAVAIFLNLDRTFQNYILEKFPNYGTGLTKIEDNPIVSRLLGESSLGQVGSSAPEIIAGGEWFNTEGGQVLSLESLRGQVVLIDFWTYSCINCLRTLPYLKTWYQEFSDDGLVIVGVHTPEFEFEKNSENVQKALEDFGLKYPVVQDNNYATWRAYNNRYWPAKYLIDQNGIIRYVHFGEGQYEETEAKIRELLAEINQQISEEIVVEDPKQKSASRTPEIYVGFSRMENLSSSQRVLTNSFFDYSTPVEVAFNHFAFNGQWQVEPEFSLSSAGSSLILEFEASQVYAVMSTSETSPARVKIYLDDQLIGEILISESKLYELINLPDSDRHQLRMEFLDEGVELYSFTFG